MIGMQNVLAVAFGGALGSTSRYVVVTLLHARFALNFPLGTLLVNVFGSFLLSLLATLFVFDSGVESPAKLMVTTGFLGGFTTYSAFSYEVIDFGTRGEFSIMAAYAFAMVALCFVAAFLGYVVAVSLRP